MNKQQIIVNGKAVEFEENLNIAKLLENLNVQSKMIAVEQNFEIISRNKFEETIIAPNDRIEIVEFMGGG